MNAERNRQVLLAARPNGEPKGSDFNLIETDIPTPAKGDVLCRTIYLSLDPYTVSYTHLRAHET